MLTADRNGTAQPAKATGMKHSANLGDQSQQLAMQVSGWRRTLRGLLDPVRAEMEGARHDFAAVGKEIHDMREELEVMAAVTAREMQALASELRDARVKCDCAPLGQRFVPAEAEEGGYGEPEIKAVPRPEVAQALDASQCDGQGDVRVEADDPFLAAARRVNAARCVNASPSLPTAGRWPDGDDVTQEEEAAIQRLEARGVYPPSGAAAWDAIRAEVARAAAPAPEIDGQGDPRFVLPPVAGPAKAGEDHGQAVVQALEAVAREQAQGENGRDSRPQPRPKPKKQPRKGGRK